MARQVKIKTVSYVHVGDHLVNTNDLNADQKQVLATWLKSTYLNTLFQGRAEFAVAKSTPEE